MAHLRLGSVAPDFEADTTEGRIKFHEWAGESWVMLFSHPGDFTPVCTTELADVSQRLPQFVKRDVKIIAISVDSLKTHFEWIDDIIEIGNMMSPSIPTCVEYPIIADGERQIATLYGMLDEQDKTNVDEDGLPYTIRTVFIIDPKRFIRTMIQYPASVGRDFDEIIRVIDALQASDKHKIATPVSWRPGSDVIIPSHISDEEARKRFSKFDTVLPYLRMTQDPTQSAKSPSCNGIGKKTSA
ncbi:1-Cys peroxiredoxin [Cristinia sonorae]|uniref:1-Cys peroxiredoxin n=1 Tax=Cristinia sonorae TaxID=1940300 RepID=A0A8K0UU46_9AGAR|nr:1-Cys peroxiredoxin [Cristinia sonorae]